MLNPRGLQHEFASRCVVLPLFPEVCQPVGGFLCHTKTDPHPKPDSEWPGQQLTLAFTYRGA